VYVHAAAKKVRLCQREPRALIGFGDEAGQDLPGILVDEIERFTFDRSNFPRGGSPGPPRFQVL